MIKKWFTIFSEPYSFKKEEKANPWDRLPSIGVFYEPHNRQKIDH